MRTKEPDSPRAFAPVKKNKQGDSDQKKTVCQQEVIDNLPAPGPLTKKDLNHSR